MPHSHFIDNYRLNTALIKLRTTTAACFQRHIYSQMSFQGATKTETVRKPIDVFTLSHIHEATAKDSALVFLTMLVL